MSTRVSRRAVFALAILIGTVLAQSERGTISGTVVDPSAAAVPGAKVVVQNKGTNVASTTVTNEVGVYAAVNLPPGEYSVRAKSKDSKSPSSAASR